jgi:hypothetical protein
LGIIIMADTQFEEWVLSQRSDVERYLEYQGIINPSVGPWPAWEVAPIFAIWAVESQRIPGKIGWWAFSGDCPTDYVSESGNCHPRAALKDLLDNWSECIPFMRKSVHGPHSRFGPQDQLKFLAEILEKRASILIEWYLDDELWEDR